MNELSLPIASLFGVRPSRIEYGAGAILATAALGVALALTAILGVQRPATIAFIPALLALMVCGCGLLAFLLFNQYHATSRSAYGVLACGYAVAAPLIALWGVAFPGVFAREPLFGAGAQTAVWLGVAWQTAIPLSAIAFALFQAWERAEPSSAAARRTVRFAGAIAVAFLGTAIVFAFRFSDELVVVRANHWSALSFAITGASLTVNVAALVTVALATRLRESLSLWLAIALLTAISGELVSGIFAGGRFTNGWYLSWGYWIAEVYVVVAAVLWRVYAVVFRLAASNQMLDSSVRRDPLTGLLNEHGFERRTRELVATCRRDMGISFLLIDVDRFRSYVTAFGRLEAAAVLELVAETVRRHARRSSDVVGRLTNDVFGVMLAATDEPGAVAVAERVRRDIRALGIRQAPGLSADVLTVSIGVATMREAQTGELELKVAARHALEQAKQAGRDRVCVADPDWIGELDLLLAGARRGE